MTGRDRDVLTAAERDPRSRRRVEDERFLTGQGRYLDDAPADGQLVAVVLRSPHAHAAIRGIDVTDALQVAGVRGIFTGEDLARDGVGHLPCSLALDQASALVVPPRPPLCVGRVRHVGDPVALVVADTRHAATDALERIVVDYETLPAVTDPTEALSPDAPVLWAEAPGNCAFHYRRGDFAAARLQFDAAAHVVELDLVNNRVVAAAMEPRAAIARWDEAGDRYLLELSGASVHQIRRETATVLGVAPDRVDLVCPDVGGGFGMKNVTYPEYPLLLWAARRLRAPIRWVAERTEDFTGGAHGRDNHTRARLALDADGRFLALSVETVANLGAYVSSLGPGAATTAPTPAMGGLYDIPAVTMDVRGAFTNTAPVDAYRGAGKPEANYLLERLIDIAAARLGVDPAELRRRNFIRAFPHRNALGFTIDCGEFAENLERALLAADRAGFEARKAQSAASGKLRGFGVGCFLETSRGQPDEEAWLRVRPDGIEVAIGTQSNGQGHETSFVQLVAARLGLPHDRFRFVQGDTRTVPRGGGHGGARSLHMGGAALLLAAEDLLRRALPIAARLLQADEAAVAYSDGAFTAMTPEGVSGTVDLIGIARALVEAGQDETPEGHGDNRCDRYTFPNGCHVAEVEVDRDSGAVTLARYTAVDDYGALLNPLLAEGQIHGGVAQGVGQALMEEALYESDGGQILSATFMDYAMPRGGDLPWLDIRFVEIPTDANPIGAKGSGQAGAIAAPQAVINAVVDALRPFGVEHIDMPATAERVWRAMSD